jgi:plastocyanin
MRRAAAAALGSLAAVLVLGAATASAATLPVDLRFQEFAPSHLDALPGDAVEWTNVSERRHTITADDGSFDSGDVFGGDRFTQAFGTTGLHAYHCTVHPGMTGEVDARRVTLGSVPSAAIPVGRRLDLNGRTADPGAAVTIEHDTGGGFAAIATAWPAADGSWSAAVTADRTGEYRAKVGADASVSRTVLVTDRRLHVRATRGGVHVMVSPAAPGARVLLQLDLRDRFGWWPATAARLDYLSRADFRVPGSARARVVLVGPDGWSPVATSRVVRVRRR